MIPFILGPQWAPGATIHQRHIGLAIWCVMGPQWAVGATVWTRGKSMSLQAFCIPSEPLEPLPEPHSRLAISEHSASPCSEPQEPLYEPHVKLPLYGHSGSTVSSGSHYLSLSCISSHSKFSGSPVSHRSHYMNHMSIEPVGDILRPQWALGSTVCKSHVHVAILIILCPQWATGAIIWIIIHECHVGWAIIDLGPQWALRATTWATCRSR